LAGCEAQQDDACSHTLITSVNALAIRISEEAQPHTHDKVKATRRVAVALKHPNLCDFSRSARFVALASCTARVQKYVDPAPNYVRVSTDVTFTWGEAPIFVTIRHIMV
jgi:hypothetical protein